VTHGNDLDVLRQLIERWCDERQLAGLSRLLRGYLALKGLTDGWAGLCDALKSTRALRREAFSASDWNSLNDLIHWMEQIVYRR
jgi:hypothetical protein